MLIDRQIKKLGFTKIDENEFYATYERYNPTYKYTQEIEIQHKENGKNILFSCDKDLEFENYMGNVCVGLTQKELKVFHKKMRWLNFKWKWICK